jgi:hypothetical protein
LIKFAGNIMVVYLLSSVTEVEHDWDSKEVIAVYSCREVAESKAVELKARLPEQPGWGGVYTYDVSEHLVL